MISTKRKFKAVMSLALVASLLLMAAMPLVADTQDEWAMRSGEAVKLQASGEGLKISPGEKADFLAAAASPRSSKTLSNAATPSAGATIYSVFNLEFNDAASCARFNVRGATVFNRFDRFADVFVAEDRNAQTVLATVATAPGLRWIDLAGKAAAPPPPSAVPGRATRETPEKIIRGGVAGLTGKGVIIAIIDSGIDFRNPDFVTYDAAGKPVSRLLYLWDTTSNAYDSQKIGSKPPLAFPNGSSIGTLYTRDQLTEELRSIQKRIPETDLNGHGTACAGIAAGNGNNAKGREEVVGVAPEADLIAVRIGGTAEATMENSYLLGSICGWLDSIAGARPMVISCSFGGHQSGHDGALISERQLNARFPDGAKGRAIVVAGGNEATKAIHSEVSFRGANAAGLTLWGAQDTARLRIYFNTANARDLMIAPAGQSRFTIESVYENPLTAQAVCSIIAPAGPGGLCLYNISGAAMKADIYIDFGQFVSAYASRRSLIGSPGTASGVITVASYNWNDQFLSTRGRLTLPELCTPSRPPVAIGNISCYSSPGYTRTGAIKPDIAAPGQYYHASLARKLDGSPVSPDLMDVSRNYSLFNGTSAAAPYVAGVVALMMQKKPALTLGEIRTLLRKNATSDQYTNDVPNIWWGYGKLDLEAAGRIINAIK